MIVARPGQNGAVLVRGSNIQLLAAGISTRARTLGRHLQDGEKIASEVTLGDGRLLSQINKEDYGPRRRVRPD